MAPSLPRFRSVAPVLIALLGLSACSQFQRQPAAVIGDRKITDGDLQVNIRLSRFIADLNRAACGQDIRQPGERAEAACVRSVLGNLILERAVEPYAEAHAISVSRGDVQRSLAILQRDVPPVQLNGPLRQEHLTVADLRPLARRSILLQRVRDAVAHDVITDAQLRQDYQARQVSFTRLHAAHILVASQAEAERIAREATSQNFGQLAKKFSTDRGSAARGGDLGTLPATQLDPDFVRAALKLQPGQISGPVHTQFGWHVIRLISVTVEPFDQVKEQLIADLAPGVFQTWLLGELRREGVEVNPRYGRYDPATGQVDRIGSTATGVPTPATPSPATPTP